jgi:hypothetical protein
VTTAELAPPLWRPWQSWEDELLADLSLSLAEVGDRTGRSYEACKKRARTLGVSAKARAELATAAAKAQQAAAAVAAQQAATDAAAQQAASVTWEWSTADEDRMIAACLDPDIVRPLAWKQFQRLPLHSVDLDELISIGNMAVVQAARMYAYPYCAGRGFDPHQLQGQRAYASARVRGALLDYLRLQDHASRNNRGIFKALSDGLTPADLHISQQKADRATAACALRPVSLDERLGGVEQDTTFAASSNLTDSAPSPESEAVVSGIMSAATAAYGALGVVGQVAVALVFHGGLSPGEPAQRINTRMADTDVQVSSERVQAALDDALLTIHQAMLKSASDGTQPDRIKIHQ